MTISFWQQDDLGPAVRCDVAVVGGGIIGCSTAYWLKKLRPDLNVVLVESRKTGQGASGRNAGFLLQGAAVDFATDVERFGAERAGRLWDFTMENRRMIEAELDPDRIALSPSGSLLLAGSAAEDERLQRSAALLQERGAACTHLTPERVRLRTGGAGFFGGLRIDSGATVHALRLVREIAGTSGARILEHHPVVAIEEQAADVVLQTPHRNVVAGRAILALNAYLPHLLPETARHIRPVRAQMLSTVPVKPWLNEPIYSHEGYYYVRQWTDGSVLLGGARHLFETEETGYDDRTTPALQEALVDYFRRHFPDAGPLRVDRRWSGVMGFTDTGLPIIDTTSARCWWAAGFNGHGMGYGFRFGRLLAEMHLEQPTGDYAGLFCLPRATSSQ